MKYPWSPLSSNWLFQTNIREQADNNVIKLLSKTIKIKSINAK